MARAPGRGPPSGTPTLTASRLAELREAGARAIPLSLDGSTAVVHDRFRGVPGVFGWTLEAWQAARELGLKVQINSTVTGHHLADLADIAALVSRLGAVSWSAFLLVPTGRGALLPVLYPRADDALPPAAAGRLRAFFGPRQAGRQEGHRRAAEMTGPGDLADLLQQEMSRRGFRPARADRGPQIEFALGLCPFAEVAADDPDTICRLHLGLAEGLTEGLGGLIAERLTVRPARRAGCRLTVRKAAAEPRIYR
ncbi:MAG TPA: radical SAM protein [Streptosporangiaceae bacterium]|nr:radical SAM protein [Streptosporangiaceae bacterium]